MLFLKKEDNMAKKTAKKDKKKDKPAQSTSALKVVENKTDNDRKVLEKGQKKETKN